MTAERRHQIMEAIQKKAHSIVPRNSKIILFGSQARGDAHDGSDWDVLVLLDKEQITLAEYDDVSYPMTELGWDMGESINTILYTKREWEKDIANPFVINVNREGIVL